MLTYEIQEKPGFTVMAVAETFQPETGYQEIPKFWQRVLSMENCPLWGVYGVCLEEAGNGGEFEYLIADPVEPGKPVPEGLILKEIPTATWAVFPCHGPIPESLQALNTRIWSQWLPNCQTHRLAMNMTIEMYAPPAERPEDSYCEIWIPVEPVEAPATDG